MPREGHDAVFAISSPKAVISIHVPREGHDGIATVQAALEKLISIHVPREGHDRSKLQQAIGAAKFQSTCPARGTTRRGIWAIHGLPNFNPRAPRGARQQMLQELAGAPIISIHVPREGHDTLENDRRSVG